MPKLNRTTCSIELGRANVQLKEYDTTYRDGAVECYIPTPDDNLPFSIRLTSESCIAPGIAAFVFIDGIYQCNRNKPAKPQASARPKTIELRLRQKEEKLPDGGFIGREWTFARLVKAQPEIVLDRQHLDNLGKIEVVILRCTYEDDRVAIMTERRASDYKHTETTMTERRPLDQKHTASTKYTKSKPAASVKAASTRGVSDANGGFLMGLFDGCAEFGLDGARDEYTGHSRRYYEQPETTSVMDPQPADVRFWYQSRDRTIHPRCYQPRYAHSGHVSNHVMGGPWPGGMPIYKSPAEPFAMPREYLPAASSSKVIAIQIKMVKKNKRGLQAVGLDCEALIQLIPSDSTIQSMDLLNPTLSQLHYLQDALQRHRGEYARRKGSKFRSERKKGHRDTSSDGRSTLDHSSLSSATEDSSISSPPEHTKKSNHKSQPGSQANAADMTGAWNEVDTVSKTKEHRSRKKRRTRDKNQHSDDQDKHTMASQHDNNKALASNADDHDNAAPPIWPSHNDTDVARNHLDQCMDDNNHNGFAAGSVHSNPWHTQVTKSSKHNAQHARPESRNSETFNAATIVMKPYWKSWKQAPMSDSQHERHVHARPVYQYSALPPPALPVNNEVEADRGVQVGKGALYGHKTRRPVYMDTVEAPYAVYIFKYCSQLKLEKILGCKITRDLSARAEKEQLMKLSKEEMAERLMELKKDDRGNGEEEESPREPGNTRPSTSRAGSVKSQQVQHTPSNVNKPASAAMFASSDNKDAAW